MRQLLERFGKAFSRPITLMVIPHGGGQAKQITLSLSFSLFIATFWLGTTLWAGFIASQQMDYWREKFNGELVRNKIGSISAQLRYARETLEEMKSVDSRLRSLLNLGDKDAIVQGGERKSSGSSGGPSPLDQSLLTRMTQVGAVDLTLEDMADAPQALRQELASVLHETTILKSRQQTLLETVSNMQIMSRKIPSDWPTSFYGKISSGFGHRLAPFSGQMENHLGLDIAAPSGSPVRATADGVVTMAGWAGGYGRVVVIDHGSGYCTRFGHNRQLLVQKGDRVRRGQIIALVGSTGNSTGPHCHYEVWFNGKALNPFKFLDRRNGA